MEEQSCGRMAADFCSELRSFCSRLESSSRSLRSSIAQAPAFPKPEKFIASMNHKVQAATTAVEALKSLTVDTVSFEELFGHCSILHKMNHDGIHELENRLEQYGYQLVDEIEETLPTPSKVVHLVLDNKPEDNIVEQTVDQPQDVDPKLESLSIEDFGLSASSLAALSTEAYSPEVYVPANTIPYVPMPADIRCRGSAENVGAFDVPKQLQPVSKIEFDNAPSWLKWQVSLEVLNEFISKLDVLLSSKVSSGCSLLTGADLSTLGSYAPAVQKACLLLLVKLQRLETGFQDGSTAYKPVYGP